MNAAVTISCFLGAAKKKRGGRKNEWGRGLDERKAEELNVLSSCHL